jgi:uncharacterized phage protein (TIGR01671 family)
MKEIKFRAWDGKNKCMDDDFFIHSSGRVCDYASRTYDTPNIEVDFYEEEIAVMQYTGLKDKYGVDIYEKDIIKVGENIYRIEYIDDYLQACVFTMDQWGWYLKGSNHFKYCQQEDNIQDYFLWQIESCEVERIGSIYENPELLSEKL